MKMTRNFGYIYNGYNGNVCLLTQGMKGGKVILLTQGMKDGNLYYIGLPQSRLYSSGSSSLVKYKRDKNIQLQMYLSLNTFYDKSLFIKNVLELKLSKNKVYTIYVKVRYDKDKFFMAGNQFGFIFNFNKDLDYLFNDIKSRLDWKTILVIII
jgi:hypothetical protein